MNPPAEVSTTLKVYQGHALEKAYLGEDFFWAVTPIAGDYILFKFDKPVNVERYSIFFTLFKQAPAELCWNKLETTVNI